MSIVDAMRACVTPPKTYDELWDWFNKYLNIQFCRHACCPDHFPPFNAIAESYFAEHSVTVWWGSRGCSKTFSLAALALCELCTLATSISVLGGSGEQSRRVHAYLTNQEPSTRGKFLYHDNGPRFLVRDYTMWGLRTIHGGELKALRASETSVRGPHPCRLRADEVDLLDLDVFESAMGQTSATETVPAQTTISSTWQLEDGVMSEVMRRADRRGWPVRRWCLECVKQPHGWLHPSEIERKRNEVSDLMWEVEYKLARPTRLGKIFTAETIAQLFRKELGIYPDMPNDPHQELIILPPDYGNFYHGTDWAKRRHFSVYTTFRYAEEPDQPDRLAAIRRLNQVPWPEMVEYHNQRVHLYGGPSAHDETGVGQVVHDLLTTDTEGFNFGHKAERDKMIGRFVLACEEGKIAYPHIEWLYDQFRYADWDALYGRGHLPDGIASGALAWHARGEDESYNRLPLMGRLVEDSIG